jgi:CRISPR-associated protein Csx17
VNIHDLNGCAPTPLAHYLKALGILRLVSEQADPQARGWWDGDRFRLATRMTQLELEDFFKSTYEPTPIFNPWGARSGYYDGGSEKSSREVLQRIEESDLKRFANYKAVITAIRSILRERFANSKPKDEDAECLILELRNNIRGKSSLWMDAVVAVVGGEGEKGFVFPSLFGTGGSEGSGSYAAAYMFAIKESLLDHKWDHAISQALFDSTATPRCAWSQTMGQFMPSGMATPWDLLLAFEGACVVRSSVSKRASVVGNSRWASSPFFVASTSYGYSSAAELDEFALNKGKRMSGRGEQWFPLWNQPMLLIEVMQIFVEGRASIRGRPASDGFSMLRSIKSLGIRTGIQEFLRYGYQQRNNLATHFAVPLGRVRVPEESNPRLCCLEDIDAWLTRLRREARSSSAPKRLKFAERSLSDAFFHVMQHPDDTNRWMKVLRSLADVEGVQKTGSGYVAGPIPALRPEWVEAANTGSPEFRLAVSFALQAAAFKSRTRIAIDPIRRHWLPLTEGKHVRFSITGSGDQTHLESRSDVVIQGRRGVDDAIALVERRLIEAAQRGARSLPLQAAPRADAVPADLAALISGSVDLDKVLALGRALMALDGTLWAQQEIRLDPPQSKEWPDDAWLAIRLAMLPWPFSDGRHVGVDPAVFRRLANGDATTATELAIRRLRAAGIRPTVRLAYVPPETARLWAAALAFSISKSTAMRFLRRLDPHALKEAP